jgi:hypothetical protein
MRIRSIRWRADTYNTKLITNHSHSLPLLIVPTTLTTISTPSQHLIYMHNMLHLATYIMMPFLGQSALSAPTPASTTFTPANTTTLPSGAENSANSGNQTLIDLLSSAATSADRIKLLPHPSDHVYDFNNPPTEDARTMGEGGHTVKADRKDFPALIGNSVSMTVGFIGPCGFNTPHVRTLSHPLSTTAQHS